MSSRRASQPIPLSSGGVVQSQGAFSSIRNQHGIP